jgi:hypothetical protein
LAEEKTLSSRRIYRGRAVNLRVDTVQMPSGRQTTREVVEHEEVVAIVAVDDKDNVLLVRQFRKPVEKELLYLYLYLATDLVHSPLKAEDSESISLVRVPLGQVPELIASGAIVDAKSIAGLLTYLEYRRSAQVV